MQVELNKDQLRSLVRCTPPDSYVHPFEKFGCVTGFPNEYWQWNDRLLDNMTEDQLWNLYQQLCEFNKNK